MKKFKKYKNRSHYNNANGVYYSVSSSPAFIDGHCVMVAEYPEQFSCIHHSALEASNE